MKNTTQYIALFGSRIFEQVPLQFINEFREAALQRGYKLLIFTTYAETPENNEGFWGEYQIIHLIEYFQVQAFVLLTDTIRYDGLTDNILKITKKRGIPAFSVGSRELDCYNLTIDYSSGFEQMVRHVVEDHGCRIVDMIAGGKGEYYSEMRVRAYRKVLEENGIAFEEERLVYGEFWEIPTRAAMKQILESPLPFPEAIVCANDTMAITACSILAERGYRVPEDVIVTGFDGIRDAKYHYPVISTCEPDYAEPILTIFEEMEYYKAHGKFKAAGGTIVFKIVKDESCGCHVPDKRNGIQMNYLASSLTDSDRHIVAMNSLGMAVCEADSIMRIAREIPVHFQPWNQCFRFACVKRELLEGYEVPESMQEMVTLMRMEEGKFERPGEVFPVEEIMPRMEEAMLDNHPIDTFYIRLLTTGMQVYGYLIEGTQGLDARTLQRSNEFTMYLSNMINIVLHNAELSEAYNRIAELSIRDSLTGLLNRRGFDQMLGKHLLKQERKILFLFSADMDRLKYINDTFGHAEGDFAIKTVAHAIEKAGGQECVCARFGGDEFVCAIVGSREGEYTEEDFCKRVDEVIAATRGVEEKPYPIQVSIGCSSMEIHEGLERDKMFLAADRIMYEKKAARKRAMIS